MSTPGKVGILIISDRGSAGVYQDKSGPVIYQIVTDALNVTVKQQAIIPDNIKIISRTLIEWVDREHLDLIFTSGGTGFAPRDVTPEATRQVIHKETPGLVFAMLRDSLAVTPHAMLSRMVAGIRNQSLIINCRAAPKPLKKNFKPFYRPCPPAWKHYQMNPQHTKAPKKG